MAKYPEMFRPASRWRAAVVAWSTAIVIAVSAMLGGCVTQPAAPSSQPGTIRPARQVTTVVRGSGGARATPTTAARGSGFTAQAGAAAGVPAVAAAETDDCAARMHDISGLLLLFYATHRALPERLEELAPLADPGTDTSFTCPVSHQPYAYVPGGLTVPGNQQRYLILYDPTPAHAGHYWGITAVPPLPGQALKTWITPLSVPVLQAYQASAPDNPPVPPPAAPQGNSSAPQPQ